MIEFKCLSRDGSNKCTHQSPKILGNAASIFHPMWSLCKSHIVIACQGMCCKGKTHVLNSLINLHVLAINVNCLRLKTPIEKFRKTGSENRFMVWSAVLSFWSKSSSKRCFLDLMTSTDPALWLVDADGRCNRRIACSESILLSTWQCIDKHSTSVTTCEY